MHNNWQFTCGWHRDLPDHRDYTLQHELVADATTRLAAADGERPDHVDWREYCPPVEDHEQLASGAAQACIGMLQYFERRAHGRLIEPSRLFVDKNARRLAQCTAGSRGSLRTTLKAIRRFGLPPEILWPFCAENVDREPEAFAFSFHDESSMLTYLRLDARGVASAVVLESAKSLLASGFCFALGFPTNSSLDASELITYPTLLDDTSGGQAVLVVGYDDRLRIRSDKGAFLIRNSWGKSWGDNGYGWLPYAYVRDQLAADLWTIIKPDWLKTGEFRQPYAVALREMT